MDPEQWPEPEKFKPERFLDNEGQLKKTERVIPFSIGLTQSSFSYTVLQKKAGCVEPTYSAIMRSKYKNRITIH